MPLESATYVSDLVAANPIDSDPVAEGNNHLNLIKTVLKATFPAITGAVSATHTAINTGVSLANAALGTAGSAIIASGTASALGRLKGIATAGDVVLVNTGTAASSGGLAIQMTDSANANSHTVLTGNYAGTVAALAAFDAPLLKQSGNTLLPTGMIVMWSGSVASIPAGWHICDGTAGTPDLRNRFVRGAGATYAVAATGGADFPVSTTAANGGHDHGASTGTGGIHDHGAATQAHTLTTAEMPSHSHTATVTDPTHTHAQVVGQGTGGVPAWNLAGTGAAFPGGTTGASATGVTVAIGSTGDDGGHTHGITAAPAHSHSIAAVAAHTHDVTVAVAPPFYALAFIMKV